MKIFLECLIVADGQMTRHSFLQEEIPVEQYDCEKHWTTKVAWEELETADAGNGVKPNIKVSQIKNAVRVFTYPEYTSEEREYLIKEGKLGILTDLPQKTEVTYEGNKPNGGSL